MVPAAMTLRLAAAFLAPLLAVSCAPIAGAQAPAPGAGAAVPAETPAQHDQRMAWWQQARFGMFIHWGLYAVPAGEWGERTDHAEWIRTTAKIPLAEYEKLRDQFNPVKFDADAWAALA